jgi:hypothetical protein
MPAPGGIATLRTSDAVTSSADVSHSFPTSTVGDTIASPLPPFEDTTIPAFSTQSTPASMTALNTVQDMSTPPSIPLEVSSPLNASNRVSKSTTSTIPKNTNTVPHIGLGIGITFGVIFLGGMAGLYLWRRSRALHDNKTRNSNSDEVDHRIRLPKVLVFNRRKDAEDDTEWSIESAEKVSILRNVRAQSVNTVSRSNSRTSEKSNGVNVAPTAMRGGNSTAALTSHPMISSYTRTGAKGGGAKEPGERESKLPNWPLGR